MRILYIGETSTHQLYADGNVPSHWFYGACEMEKDGHEVIWEQESSAKLNDLKLIKKYRPDIIFIPNLNIHNHLLLLAFAGKFIKTPIFAYLHHEPQAKTGLKAKIFRHLLSGIRHLFFLSEKSLIETAKANLIDSSRCSIPGWGPDVDFYSRIETSDNGRFVSTGKENRDFDILIEAFRQTGAPLHIITATAHNGADYTNLTEKCKDSPNIKVTIVQNSSGNYPMMLHEMAAARALVCPLRQDKLNYCVGLSTIADAEGLGKPLIITANPYHDSERVAETGISVTSVNDWVEAIRAFMNCPEKNKSLYSMASAYKNMKSIMEL